MPTHVPSARIHPITLSTTHLVYMVLTLTLLGAAVWIMSQGAFRLFWAERVVLPRLQREFGFTLDTEAVPWMSVASIVPGGLFDRLGIRVNDAPIGTTDYTFHHGLPDFTDLLEEARRGHRVRLDVVAPSEWRDGPYRCTWIDLADLRADASRRRFADTLSCTPAEGAR